MADNGFQELSLGDVLDFRNGKAISPSKYSPAGKHPVFGSNGRIARSDDILNSQPVIAIGRVGAYCGSVYYIPEPSWVTDNAIVATPKDQNHLRFLYYLLGHLDLRRTAIGSAQPLMTQGGLNVVRALLPSPHEQEAIACILGALDDKIELNRRTNRTLESIARAIFKSWFIDFDPVRAKSQTGRGGAAGQSPPGLAPHLAALFPVAVETSELGEIPTGWSFAPLSELAVVIMGTSPASETYNDVGLGIPLINGPVEFGDRFAIKSKWTTAEVRRCKLGDLIFCVRGSTTGRRVLADDEYGLGRGVCAIRGRGDNQPYINVAIELELPRMLSKASGSVFPSLSSADIRDFHLLHPGDEILHAFHSIVGVLQSKADLLARQSSTLAALRDALLPKLISGELRVPDAERIVGRAV